MPSGSSTKPDVVVLGAGVIGLASALKLAERGMKPVIVARDLPQDSQSTAFASPWANCSWHPYMHPGATEGPYDAATFHALREIQKTHPELVEYIPFMDVFPEEVPKDQIWYSPLVGPYEEISTPASLPVHATHPFAHRWNSYVINAPQYIIHLGEQLAKVGIPIIRRTVLSIEESYNLPEVGPVNLVVNATALGSRTLKGVEDSNVHAAKGHMVLARAPHVKRAILRMETWAEEAASGKGPAGGKDSNIAYIIPRPGGEHLVMLGGTYLPNDENCMPDEKEGESILRRCYDLDPLLAGPDGKDWRDIDVVKHIAGLRPARTGGPRVELEEKQMNGEHVGLIHAYGFGALGFIAHVGAAEKVSKLASRFSKV